MPKRTHYWKTYHASRKYDDQQIFNFIGSVVRNQKRPFKKKGKRGRKLKFDPYDYATYIVYADLKDYSYRDAESSASLVIGKTIDHSTFGKIYKKLPLDYIKKIRRLLRNLIVCTGMKFVRIPDSTGIETDRYELVKKIRKKRRRKHLKRHIISDYFPDFGISTIEASKATKGYANDSPQLRRMIEEEGCRNGLLLADRGYDSPKNRKFCEEHKIKPIIKLKGEIPFPNSLYEYLYKKLRGLVETNFGGYESWHGNKTRMRLPETQALDIEFMSICQMIRTYFKILEVEKLVLKIIYLIFRQPREIR